MMKVAIHQPNYLPWIGYFDKLDQVDCFVLLDRALHSKSSYVHRTMIKTPNGGLQLTIPLKNKGQPIDALKVDQSQRWQLRHWRAIEANYKKSAYWSMYKDDLERLYKQSWTHLADFTCALIAELVSLLNIETDILRESDFPQAFGRKNERNANIVGHVGGDTYVSGVGARIYNDEQLFRARGIQLVYQQFQHPVYTQRWGDFLPNASIVDMLFHCGPETMTLIREGRVAQTDGR